MFMYKLKSDKRGMTLIEMIISLVILSILMTSTLGMITSSMSVFTATSEAAIDRMVGNSIYSTIQSSLRYATKIKIRNSDSPDPTSTLPSMHIKINAKADSNNPAGKLMYRRSGDNYLNIYGNDFYKNRTVQYSVHRADGITGADGRHVKITVNIFRNGEKVYTKNSIIKCVNIDLIANAGTGIDDTSSPSSVNQYLYFSNDELLIAGGLNAWSTEFKINEYMNRYNKILSDYYSSFVDANKDLNKVLEVNRNAEGKRIQVETFKEMVDKRDLILFGKGASGEPTAGKNPVNLKAFYQGKMKALLTFVPTRANLGSDNPFDGIVATKEELYTGFMLTYFDKNKSRKIERDEYPAFAEDGFFDGTVLKNYNGPDNGMKILCYFKDNMAEDFTKICQSSRHAIFTYKDISNPTIKKEYISDYPAEVPNHFDFGPGRDPLTDKNVFPFTEETINKQSLDNLCISIRARDNSRTNNTVHPESVRFTFLYDKGLMRPNVSANDAKDANGNIIRSNVVLGDYIETNYEYGSDMKKALDANGNLKISNQLGPELVTILGAEKLDWTHVGTQDMSDHTEKAARLEIVAPRDLYEGWYYIENDDIDIKLPGSGKWFGKSWLKGENYHFFYLEGIQEEGISNEDLIKSQMMDAAGNKIAMKKGDKIQIFVNWGESAGTGRNRARFFCYERSKLIKTESEVKPINADFYTVSPQPHQYDDFILYGVDWNSWFRTSQQGLLNKLIGGVAGWFTGQRDITTISGVNAEQALGLKGKYNINNISTNMCSYNLLWTVYDTHRGTWYYLPSNTNALNSAWSGLKWTSQKNSPVPLNLDSWKYSSTSINTYIERLMIPKDYMFGLIERDRDARWVPLPTGGGIDRNEIPTVPEDPVTP